MFAAARHESRHALLARPGMVELGPDGSDDMLDLAAGSGPEEVAAGDEGRGGTVELGEDSADAKSFRGGDAECPRGRSTRLPGPTRTPRKKRKGSEHAECPRGGGARLPSTRTARKRSKGAGHAECTRGGGARPPTRTISDLHECFTWAYDALVILRSRMGEELH